MHKIVLPFPPWSLSPNARNDRRGMTKTRKGYKFICAGLARNLKISLDKKPVAIAVLFYPPKLNVDLDNCLAAAKSGLDGVAIGLGVDDKFFKPIIIDIVERDSPHGRVEVYIDNVDIVDNSFNNLITKMIRT